MKEEKKEKKFPLKKDTDEEISGSEDEDKVQTFFHNNAIDDDKILNKEQK